PRRLRRPEGSEEPPQPGTRPDTQGFHDLPAVEEGRRGEGGCFLGVAGHELVQHATPGSIPDLEGRVAPQPRPVGQGEEEQVERVVAQVPEEAGAPPPRHPPPPPP